MAESNTGDDVIQNSWNIKIYALLSLVKDYNHGQFRKPILELKERFSSGLAKHILENVNGYFELQDCLLCTQTYDALNVGSVAEDVPIHRFYKQVDKDDDTDMIDDGTLLEFDIYWECDLNLCFKNIFATDSHQEFRGQDSKSISSLELQVIPTSLAGQVELVVPPSTDDSSIQGISKLCVEDGKGATLLSSELLVNQLYNLLTLTTAIINVTKCQTQVLVTNIQEDVNESLYATSPQYVGQAGPAVHIVTCVPFKKCDGTINCVFVTEDVCISVPCRKWPSCAIDWSLRPRLSGWPSRELIDEVLKGGCHLVPKYDPSAVRDHATCTVVSSDVAPKTRWRYSFSLAEKKLINSITEDQKLCYLVFKYLFARFVKLESIITTYTAKTIFLWELENVPSDQWSFSKAGDRVKELCRKLKICVENKYCQHYFINGCNTLQQMDEKSRRATLDSGFTMFEEEMDERPDMETGIFETTQDFPFYLMYTYKTFHPINVWLEALAFQMRANMDPQDKTPSEKNIQDFLDSSKVHPFQMPEILIHLTRAQELYGQPLPVPKSLLQQEKVTGLVQFLKLSTTSAKFGECMDDLDVELKFLHLQFKIISEIELLLADDPTIVYKFED